MFEVISKENFGFLRNRKILDVVGITQEVLHSVKKHKLDAMILKMDLVKAYDLVNWNFPRLVFLQINGWGNLNKLCFPNQWFSYQFFFKAIGGRGITKFKISKCWSLIKFEESLQLWVSSTYAFKELPLVVSWVIWKHRNSIIFDNAHKNVI